MNNTYAALVQIVSGLVGIIYAARNYASNALLCLERAVYRPMDGAYKRLAAPRCWTEECGAEPGRVGPSRCSLNHSLDSMRG